jgi:uncharacterized protein (TIGR00251 family)
MSNCSQPSPESPVPENCRLEIKVVPNAPKNEVVGWLGNALKVKVHAPPEEGKANAELCVFLANTLGLPKGWVRLGRGASSRSKVIVIEGMSWERIMELLPPKVPGPVDGVIHNPDSGGKRS